MKSLYITIALVISAQYSFSQLITVTTIPDQLVQDVLAGWGLVTYDATTTGAVGYFVSDNTVLYGDYGIENGAVLTTGTILDTDDGPHGPNNEDDDGVDTGGGGSGLLSSLVGGTNTYDLAKLEFKVVAISDSLSFQFLFGSEEYPEYVGSQFSDVFGIFISGPGITGEFNMATLPNSSTPVNINTINADTNSAYYVANNIDTTDYTLEYDGFTIPMQAKVGGLQVGESYTIKILLADAGDGIYDSGIFIPGKSMIASTHSITADQIAIYPNPVTNAMNVDFPSTLNNSSYSIIDYSGRLIMTGSLSHSIDVSKLDKGKYFLVLDGNTPIVKTFQKQ